MADKKKEEPTVVRPQLVATVDDKGKVKPVVIDMDPRVHTPEHPTCGDPTCPCQEEEA